MTTSTDRPPFAPASRDSEPDGARQSTRVIGTLARSRPILLPVVLAGVWELSARLELISSALFPSLTEVWRILIDWIVPTNGTATLYAGTWAAHVWASTSRVLVGFAIGTIVALLLGVLVGRSRVWRSLVDPLLQGLRPVPITAWVPLAVIWFGIGYKPAIFLVVLGAFFPVYVNTVHAVSHVDDRLIRAARMLGAAPAVMLRRVTLPAALPVIAEGMRVGLGFAWMCVIVSEMLAVKSGLGYVLWDSYYFANIPLVVASMITIGSLGFLSDRILQATLGKGTAWARQEEGS